MNWSHSRLDTFRRCPRRYQLHYVLEQPEEPMPQLENGALLHDMIREYGQWCYDNGRLDCDSGYARTVASRADDGNVQRQFLAFAGRQLWDFDGVLGRTGELFETWHEHALPDNFGQFRARVDWCTLRDGVLELTDWKSGWLYPTVQPEEAPVQLKRYAWLLVNEFGAQVEEVHVRLEYIGSGAGWNWQVDLGDIGDIEEQLVADVAEVIEYGKRLGEDEWRLEPGSHCEGCGYRRECAACADGYLAEAEYPSNCVKAIHLHGAGRAAATDSLRKHVEQYGNYVDSDGLEWGPHKQKPKRVIRKGKHRAFLDALEVAKKDPEDHMQGTKLDSLEGDAWDEYIEEKPGGRRWSAKRAIADSEQEAESDE